MATVTASAPCRDHARLIREGLAAIHQVESAYLKETERGLSLFVIVPEKNVHVEEQIYETLSEILDRCPDVRLDFRVLSRRGRPITEVATLTGTPILERAAQPA